MHPITPDNTKPNNSSPSASAVPSATAAATATSNPLQTALKQAGLRVTPQRLAIAGLLRGTKSHPSPEMVYQSLKGEYPGLSLNTVYKTLHALEDAGLLRRISMEDNTYRYDANVTPHAHRVCRGCGRVDDADEAELTPLLEDLLRQGRLARGWDIQAMDCCYFGYCPECVERRSLSIIMRGYNNGTRSHQRSEALRD